MSCNGSDLAWFPECRTTGCLQDGRQVVGRQYMVAPVQWDDNGSKQARSCVKAKTDCYGCLDAIRFQRLSGWEPLGKDDLFTAQNFEKCTDVGDTKCVAPASVLVTTESYCDGRW